MALTLPKFTVAFQNFAGQGWTESWYLQRASTINDVISAANAYIAGRQLFLATDCWMTYARCGDAAVKRFVQPIQPSPTQTMGLGEGSENTTNDAVNIRCSTSITNPTIHRRSFLMGGIPDGVVNSVTYASTGGVNPASGWYNVATSFLNGFVASNLGIRYVSAVGPPIVYGIYPVVNFLIRVSATRRRGNFFGQRRGRRLTT